MSDIREALVARQREEYGESWDVLVPEVGWTLGRIIESVIEDALSDVTPRGEAQWWESLVEVACDKGHRIFIDDGDGGVYACPACALLPTVKPSVEDVAAAIEAETASYDPVTSPERGEPESLLAADGSDMSLSAARAVLALLPGRTEAEVKAEALREAADWLAGMVGESGPGSRATGHGRAGLDIIARIRDRAARIARGEGA